MAAPAIDRTLSALATVAAPQQSIALAHSTENLVQASTSSSGTVFGLQPGQAARLILTDPELQPARPLHFCQGFYISSSLRIAHARIPPGLPPWLVPSTVPEALCGIGLICRHGEQDLLLQPCRAKQCSWPCWQCGPERTVFNVAATRCNNPPGHGIITHRTKGRGDTIPCVVPPWRCRPPESLSCSLLTTDPVILRQGLQN